MLEEKRSGRSSMLRSSRLGAEKDARNSEQTRLRQVVLGYLRQAKVSMTLAALCMLGLTVTELLRPWPLKIVFDYILLDKPLPQYLAFLGGLFGSGNVTALVVMVVAIVVIALLMGAFTYLQVYATSR